jgi:hypothetical protein
MEDLTEKLKAPALGPYAETERGRCSQVPVADLPIDAVLSREYCSLRISALPQ